MWRVIDTGLRSAAQNIALNRALLEARHAEEIPSTLRFLRFTPSALLACRQSPAQEFDLACCASANIAVQRRVTGGDAICADESDLGWELYLHRRDVGALDMHAVAKRICHAAAAAVGALGVDARYRARHDIEVDGRVISSGGGVFEGDALLYQGVMRLGGGGSMLGALRMAWASATGDATASSARATTLQTLAGAGVMRIRANLLAAFESEFAVEFHDGELSLTEHARYLRALAEIDAPGWINLVNQAAADAPLCAASLECAAGILRTRLIYDRLASRIKQVYFDRAVAVAPSRTLADLEAALRDTAIERLAYNVGVFFAGRAVDMRLLTPGDFVTVMRRALKLPLVAQNP